MARIAGFHPAGPGSIPGVGELHKHLENKFQSNFQPFVWSVTQLVRFFRDPKMANLLTGPGINQQPL